MYTNLKHVNPNKAVVILSKYDIKKSRCKSQILKIKINDMCQNR